MTWPASQSQQHHYTTTTTITITISLSQPLQAHNRFRASMSAGTRLFFSDSPFHLRQGCVGWGWLAGWLAGWMTSWLRAHERYRCRSHALVIAARKNNGYNSLAFSHRRILPFNYRSDGR
ncbi:hypothetical protein E2C01_086557 [Portunus trituberculatus]|uniref:Uncharacterized protein n=1 Tax=Portunus trituberculatus TaxID=210409 RepID=A0A5B7JAN0_PORTR|nr:hypothetical protein [Portunus trituberculatus]